MGQAKNRGTFEERKAKAIERDNHEAEQRAKREMEYKANRMKDNVMLVGGGHNRGLRRAMVMAMASALAPPPVLVVEVKNKK